MTKTSHLASLWNGGWDELGNGLFRGNTELGSEWKLKKLTSVILSLCKGDIHEDRNCQSVIISRLFQVAWLVKLTTLELIWNGRHGHGNEKLRETDGCMSSLCLVIGSFDCLFKAKPTVICTLVFSRAWPQFLKGCIVPFKIHYRTIKVSSA